MDRTSSRALLALVVMGLAASGAIGQEDVPSVVEAPPFSPFGDLPVDFGFAFPGGGNLSYNVSTPILMGLQQLPDALEGNVGNISEGGWVNVTLPEPLQVEFNITFRAVDRQGSEKVYMSDVKYVMSGIKVAIEVAQEITDILSQCLGIRNTTVQVLNVFETAKCTVAGGAVDTVGDCHEGTQQPEAQPATPEGVSWALGETLKEPEVAEQIKEALKRAINSRYEFCCARKADDSRGKGFVPEETPAAVDPFLAIVVTLCLLLVLGVLMGVFWCGCCMGCCCWHNADEAPAEKEFLDQCDSLVASRSMPLLVRIAFYLLIAVNVLFFLSANISLGATINIDYIVEGELIRNPSFYDFSIAATAIEMIDAGIYLLGIILLGFSVVWPYVKLVILAAMFTLPPRWLRPVRRLSIMQWIDTLGKWSMFDVFALSGCMALFYIEVYSPDTILFPLGYYGIILSMTPVWGMFANLIAQIISQGLSIFGLWAHEVAYVRDWHAFHGGKEGSEEKELQPLSVKDGEQPPSGKEENGHAADTGEAQVPPPRKAALATPPPMPPLAVMSQKTPGVENQQQFTLWAKLLLLAMLVATMAFIVCGNFVIGFKLQVVGVLGLIQDLAIPGSSVRSFTPITVAEEMIRAIPPNGGAGIFIGTWALIIVMVACVLVVPLVQASALLALWAVPMPLTWIKRLLKANEILASWQYMEVFLIAVVVGGIQIPFLCVLLVGNTCDPIQPLLNFLVRTGVMSHATCFNARVIVEAGLWFLFFASILLYICSVVVREKAGSVVVLYDPFCAAQYDRGLAHGQFLYYKNRTDALRTIGLLEYCGELEGDAGGKSPLSAKDDTPVAGVVV